MMMDHWWWWINEEWKPTMVFPGFPCISYINLQHWQPGDNTCFNQFLAQPLGHESAIGSTLFHHVWSLSYSVQLRYCNMFTTASCDVTVSANHSSLLVLHSNQDMNGYDTWSVSIWADQVSLPQGLLWLIHFPPHLPCNRRDTNPWLSIQAMQWQASPRDVSARGRAMDPRTLLQATCHCRHLAVALRCKKTLCGYSISA